MNTKNGLSLSPSPLVIERRAFDRYTPKQTINSSLQSFSVMKDCHLYEIDGDVADISLGGLKFITKQQLSLVTEDIVNVNVVWNHESFQLTGKIVWRALDSGIYNIGIAFEKETRKSETLKQIIEDIAQNEA